MANRIKARTEWLDGCADAFRAIEGALQAAHGTLSGISLNKAEGGELKVSLNLGLRLTGTHYSGSTAQADVQALSRATQALAVRVDRLGSAATAAARAFEDAENTAIRLMRGVQGGTEAGVYEDGEIVQNMLITPIIMPVVVPWVLQWVSDIINNSNETPDPQEAQDQLMREQINALFTEERFSKSRWEKGDINEKQRMLNELKDELNRIYGTNITKPVNIDYNDTSTYGYYSDSRREITITKYAIDKYSFEENMDTMVHEMRHAYQHEVIRHPENYSVNEETVQAWINNTTNYTSGGSDYRTQPLEQDAWDFAGSIDYDGPSWREKLFR